jgi:hypothetical protein
MDSLRSTRSGGKPHSHPNEFEEGMSLDMIFTQRDCVVFAHHAYPGFYTIIIIIHLLGLAPAGCWLHRTTARSAAIRESAAKHLTSDGCHAVPLNSAEFAGGKKPPRRKRSRLRFWKGDYWPHAYPFSLSRPRPVASLQLCSPLENVLSSVG